MNELHMIRMRGLMPFLDLNSKSNVDDIIKLNISYIQENRCVIINGKSDMKKTTDLKNYKDIHDIEGLFHAELDWAWFSKI